MEKIAIVGTGGFAREVLSLIMDINRQSSKYDFLGFVDSDDSHVIHGYPIIGNDDEVNETKEHLSLAIAVGEPQIKERIRNKYNNPLVSFPTLVHPSVIIGDKTSVRFGEGCILCAGSILTTDIRIDNFVTLNLQCTVGHDTIIEDYVSCMPSVNISGEVLVHKGAYLGTGTNVINRLDIGQYAIVGAGAVVTKNLPAFCTAVGVPARPIKKRIK